MAACRTAGGARDRQGHAREIRLFRIDDPNDLVGERGIVAVEWGRDHIGGSGYASANLSRVMPRRIGSTTFVPVLIARLASARISAVGQCLLMKFWFTTARPYRDRLRLRPAAPRIAFRSAFFPARTAKTSRKMWLSLLREADPGIAKL